MQERLQKIISTRGAASRRAAEELIKQGRVKVNGAVAALGDKADADTDIIEIDGKALRAGDEPVYIALNKPRGYVTTMSDEKGRKTVAELTEDCGARVYPVGRLDINSEGLLIMTNDGDAAYKLMHPSFESEKTYRVTVSGDVRAGMAALGSEMVIDGYTVSPAKTELIAAYGDRYVLLITIHEGRNRQVRKMCAQAGLEVHRLVRVSEGEITLGELKKGTWRYLTESELAYIRGLCRQTKKNDE